MLGKATKSAWVSFSFRKGLFAFLALTCATSVMWGHFRDPFRRMEFTLQDAKGAKISGIAVLPAAGGRYPLVIYLPGTGEDAVTQGTTLQQLAEWNLAAVALERAPGDEESLGKVLPILRKFLRTQPWARQDSVAWIGPSAEAGQLLACCRNDAPQLLVLGGDGVPGDSTSRRDLREGPDRRFARTNRSAFRVLLIQGVADAPSTVGRIRELLKDNGLSADSAVFPTRGLDLWKDRLTIVRGIAEYWACRNGIRSPIERNIRPSYWWLWVPFLLCLGVGVSFWGRKWVWRSPGRAGQVLSCVVVVVVIGTGTQAAIRFGLPQLSVSDETAAWTRRMLVAPWGDGDFDWLVRQPVWKDQKMAAVLTHLKLAGLQRTHFYPKLEAATYRNFMLSPQIGGENAGDLNWRWPLWESFYPLVRRETQVCEAAKIVVRFLRERVSILPESRPRVGVREIWASGVTDPAGFQFAYVAALRSVGIAARFSQKEQVELFDGVEWRPAPPPSFEVFSHRLAPPGF